MAAAILAGVTLTAHDANAQSSCKWYGATALKQQQTNEKLKCNLEGPAWHSDFGAHMAWCATVSPDQWKKSAQERDKQLSACAKK